MKLSSLLFGVLATICAWAASSQEAQLPNAYDVKIVITEPGGGVREARAVVSEGAKATLRTNEAIAPTGTSPLKINFSVISDPIASTRIGRDVVDIDVALFGAYGTEWRRISNPRVTIALGSARPATVTMDNSGYAFSITASKVDPGP